MRWYRELPSRPHSQGSASLNGVAMISRVLAADLPSHVGAQVCIAGWLHRRRQLKSMTFLVIRDRSGLAQVVLTSAEQVAAAAELPEETVVAVAGTVVASDQAPDGAEIVRPVITPLSGPAQPPPFDLYRPAVTAALPTILRPRAGQPAAPAAAGAVRDQRGRRGRVPRRPGRPRLHRDQHAQDRRVGHRVGGERVRPRLLRPGRLPGAVAAVLQAGHGRRVRARLRDRSRLPGRAARHRPPPGRST